MHIQSSSTCRRQSGVILVTSLVFLLGTPCLVFSTLTKLEVDPAALGEIAFAAALALLCFMIVGAAILKLAGLP